MTDGTLDRLTQAAAQFSAGPDIYGTTVDLESAEYAQFERFQVERFARLQSSRPGGESDTSPTYTEATHTLPSEVVPIVVRRRHSPGAAPHADDEMLGIARLEFPGATLIESMIALREGSVTARALAEGKAAEIGGFAALEGIDRQDLISVVDAIVGVVSELARQRGLEWLWIFPRAAFMSLLRAEIPNALPPYHFTVSPDIVGWVPGSSQLEAFRSMRLRGFLEIPLIYQITAGTLADDLETRMARYEQRVQLGSRLDSLLGRAMISVQRTLRQEIELLYPSPASSASSARIPNRKSASQTSDLGDASVSFLPSGLSSNVPLASYLHRVLSEGGVPAQAYKELSYSLLDIQPGQRILDVGCGAGVDLPALARIAGPTSTVVGLEINSNLVQEARQVAGDHLDGAAANMLVFHGDAQQMTIPDAEFDRARTDRALQHFPHPKRALAEIWRVLKPGGILTLVEPDWGAMVVAPGSAAGDGDESVNKALDWCRRHLAHPLIGRNLNGLLGAMRSGSWQSLKVVVAPFTFSDWKAMDAVLLLSHAARALQQERPEHAAEIDRWLQAVSTASADGSFFGYIPMFYAVAVKAAHR